MTGREATSNDTAPSIAAHHDSLPVSYKKKGELRVNVVLLKKLTGCHQGDSNDCRGCYETAEGEYKEEGVS